MADRDFPSDVHAESGCRVPMVKRDDIGVPEAQALFDHHTVPSSKSLAGLWGPGGIKLHSPKLALASQAIGKYLRWESGIAEPIRELAILITARCHDSRFEWAAHEPEGLRVGLTQEAIDVVKHRKPVDGLPEDYATIITLGREVFEDRYVKPETFAAAERIFGRQQMVDIVSLMGLYAGTAALLCAYDIQLHDGPQAELPVP
jgi:4-carboxymuconolactone decarboxylase